MLTAGNFWLLVKALIAITPWLVTQIQSGRIRAASQQELSDAILDEIGKRIERAKAAKENDDLPDPYADEYDAYVKRLRDKGL